MVASAPTVTAWFDLTSSGGNYFTLDDTTKGVLDSVYILGGVLASDITAESTSIRIDRGRSNNFDETDPGQASISLLNHDRQFDPTHYDGTYFGNVKPGRRMDVSVAGITIYSGAVDDWNFTYDVSGDARAEATLVDHLGLLAQRTLASHTATSQLAGARVTAVLNRSEVAFGASRSIDSGGSTLQADVVAEGTNVLEYLQLVAKTDMGYLYVSRDGVLVFKDRNTALENPTGVVFSDATVYDGYLVSETGEILTDESGLPLLVDESTTTAIGFHGATTSFGSELLFNRVVVSREGGSTEIFTDTDSVAEYGTFTLNRTGLLYNSDNDSVGCGRLLIGLYAVPEMRVASVTVKLHALSVAEQRQVLSLDLSDLVRVVWTPQGVGDTLDRWCVIEGITHEIDPGSHVVTFRLSEASRWLLFTLDDSIAGVLAGVTADVTNQIVSITTEAVLSF